LEKMIIAENLSYEYKTQYEENGKNETRVILALNNINITIEKGSFVAILGHNGSGKSTFAKHINALVKPTKGSLIVGGFDTRNDEFVWDIRQKAGMVFQNPDNQIVATIVEEDVAFGPENMGVEPEEIRKRVDNALATVRMEEFRRSVPSKLSGGQKQRIAIAGVLAMKPEVIILDEPTAMLDPEGRKDVIRTITRLNKEENLTTVLITHYMDETVGADRIIVIDDGNVVLDGKPREVLVQVEKMRSYGLEVPQATELAFNLRKLGYDIPEDILTPEEMVGALCRLKSKA